MRSSALRYYVSSIPTILKGISNFYLLPLLLLGIDITIQLKNGLRFKVKKLMEVWAIKEVCLDRVYEQFDKIAPGWVIIDIGASIGDFSIMNAGNAKRILSFEKDENCVRRMREHILLNGSKNIELFNEAVFSLNDIFLRFKLDRIDFLKIDCEGCEYDILNGTHTDVFNKVGSIVMEYHLFSSEMKTKFEQLKKVLKNNSYKITIKKDPVHEYLGLLYACR